MLSFTICGGFAPWARTDGACAASASPTAVERTEAASRRLLMIGPLVGVSWRDLGRFAAAAARLHVVCKNTLLPAWRHVVYGNRRNSATRVANPGEADVPRAAQAHTAIDVGDLVCRVGRAARTRRRRCRRARLVATHGPCPG